MKSLALFAALSAASAVLAQDSFTLKPTYVEGQVFRFNNTAQFDVMGMVIDASFVDVRRTVSVSDDSATIENSQENFKVVVDGAEQDVPVTTVTSKYSLMGVLMSMTGDMVASEAYRAAMVDHFSYPEAPVKVGDEWTKEYAADSAKRTPAGKGTFKVIAQEELMGMTVLKIQGDNKESTGSAPAGGSGYFWVNVADGQVVKMERTWTNVPLPASPFPLSGRFNSVIVLDEN